MKDRISLEEALDICLVQLESGGMTLEACLALFPQYADELRPLLMAAQTLHTGAAAPATPQQIQKIQERILQRGNSPKVIQFHWLIQQMSWGWRVAVASLLLVILGILLVIFTQNNQPDGGLLSSAAQRRTPTPNHIPEDALPIRIIFSGIVDSVTDQTLIVNRVSIKAAPGLLSGIQPGTWILVEGELLDNGTILAEKITPFPQDPPDEELCLEESPSPCHPLLVMLAEHFEKPYAQLEKLQQEGLGIGEIARLLTLEQASTHTLESLIAERQAGKDWAAILRAYPEIMPEALQITISLENT